MHNKLSTAVFAAAVFVLSASQAQVAIKPPVSGILFDAGKAGTINAKGCTTEVVDVEGGKALKIIFNTTEKWPKAEFVGPWDLTGYTGIEAKITNIGTVPEKVSLRADNPGSVNDKPWNMAVAYDGIAPGQSMTLRIDFGYNNFRAKAPSYPLDPSKISAIMVTMGTPKQEVSFRLDSLKAVK